MLKKITRQVQCEGIELSISYPEWKDYYAPRMLRRLADEIEEEQKKDKAELKSN